MSDEESTLTVLETSFSCDVCQARVVRRVSYARSAGRSEWKDIWLDNAKRTALAALRHAQEVHGILLDGASVDDFHKDFTR